MGQLMVRAVRVFALLVLLANGVGSSEISFAGAFPSKSERRDVTSLVEGGQIRLSDGQAIDLGFARQQRLYGSDDVRVIFEDLQPGANWSHPARMLLQRRSGEVIARWNVEFPPEGLEALEEFSRRRIEFNLSDLGGARKVANPERFYAVLINGSADQRHWNDTAFLYRVLVQVYGYKKANIWVADGNFVRKAPDLDGDGAPDIRLGSNLSDVRGLLRDLKSVLTVSDQLLIATNGHGVRLEGESALYLQDGQMKASEFASWLKELAPRRVLSMHQPCYSGGLVRPTVFGNRMSMAAARDVEVSWGTADLTFNEFFYNLTTAFAGQNHQGVAVSSDLDGDGRVSVSEAFAWAVARNAQKESPLLEADNESNPDRPRARGMGIGF